MINFIHTKELYLFYYEIVAESLYKRIFERKIFFFFKLSILWLASIVMVIILSFIWPLVVGSFLVSAVVDVMIWARIKLKLINGIKIFFRFFIGIGLIIWLIIAGPHLMKYTKKIIDGSPNTQSATRIESKTGTPLIDPENMASEDQKWYAETELYTAVRSGTLSKIVRVVDGDTIIVDMADKKETIRLIGINAPEMLESQDKSAECFAQESANYFKRSLLNKYIRLEIDPTQGERDKYNRLLRYVILKDGSNFNETLIREGMSKEYTYKTPYKYQKEFKLAEQEARKAKIGLWDLCYNDK